jgi:small subunit ribosomal protein S20
LANIKSAKKRAKQAEVRRERNVARRSAMRTQVKKFLKVVEAGDISTANDVFRQTASILDKSAREGLIHKNKAARTKSRLNKKIKLLVMKDKEKSSVTA